MKTTIAVLSLACTFTAPYFLAPDAPAPIYAQTWNCPAGRLEIRADGAVRYLANGRAAVTGRVTAARPATQLTLTGAPTVTDGQHALRGERVVLFLDDERLECEGCELVLPDPSPK